VGAGGAQRGTSVIRSRPAELKAALRKTVRQAGQEREETVSRGEVRNRKGNSRKDSGTRVPWEEKKGKDE